MPLERFDLMILHDARGKAHDLIAGAISFGQLVKIPAGRDFVKLLQLCEIVLRQWKANRLAEIAEEVDRRLIAIGEKVVFQRQ